MLNRIVRTWSAFCLLVIFSAASAFAAETKPIGINFEGMSDYMSADMLIDLTETARPFGLFDKPWINEPGKIKVDAQGWPLEDAGIVLRAAAATSDVQKFAYSFKGKADIKYFPDNKIQIVDSNYDSAANLSSGHFTLAAGEGTLNMIFQNTTGGIRDLRVLRDEPAVGSFTKRFIDRASIFKGKVIRFMDLQATNGSEQATWEKRSKPEDWNWRGTMPVETLVELANTLGSDPWFCMPHKADDNYVRQFATYVRDHLADGRTAYVEHSNEVWNGQFQQARDAITEGVKRGLGEGYMAQLQYHGTRTSEIGRIWKEVFAAKPGAKVVIVLGSQAANPDVANIAMTPPGVEAGIDAIAIAPYMGQATPPEDADRVAALTDDQVLDELKKRIDPGGEVDQWLTAYEKYCKAHHKRLIAYEAGQHMVGRTGAENNDRLTAVLIAANRNPRMGVLYKQYLSLWFSHSNDVICMFAFTSMPQKWGSWGLLEALDQPVEQAPKFKAVNDLLTNQN